MQNQPTAEPEWREPGSVSPVIAGGVRLEDEPEDDPGRTLAPQLRLPVSADELAATLYYDGQLCPANLSADENVWGIAAAAIVQDGLGAIELHADLVLRDLAQWTLASPGWPEHCRRRVAEVTGAAASCPAGRA